MSTTSPFIKMTLQALDENPDTWGTVLNVSALELLEDAIAGSASADVTSGNVALNEDAGADNAPHYRMMIIDINGAPGAARSVTCPATSQVYLVANNTTGGQTITFKTTAGTGVTIPASKAIWCYCDGTNILDAESKNSATTDLATDSLDSQLLNGLASSAFGRLAVASTWTKGQVVQRVSKTVNGAGPYTLDLNMADSNTFYHLTTQNFTLTAPTNATIGQSFSLIVEQGAGGPHTISFPASTYQFESGTAPTLSTTLGDVDYLSFEYYASSAGNRWIGAIIKDVSDV